MYNTETDTCTLIHVGMCKYGVPARRMEVNGTAQRLRQGVAPAQLSERL